MTEGRRSDPAADVVVVGAGVAGLMAAIAAATSGLSVRVLERGADLPAGPGETLHPGAGPIFRQFGILEEIEAAGGARPLGVETFLGGVRSRQGYGADGTGPWRGYQVPRRRLCEILARKAQALGVHVEYGVRVGGFEERSAGGLRIRRPDGAVRCGWAIDASGAANWSARCARRPISRRSPPLLVAYGYGRPDRDAVDPDWPIFAEEPWGRSWRAALGDGRTAFVDMFCARDRTRRAPIAGERLMDVTWRVSSDGAPVGRVLEVGDAAGRLDPSAGHGVLRAMMSAIMAAHLIAAARADRVAADDVAAMHRTWLLDWLSQDIAAIHALPGGRIWDGGTVRSQVSTYVKDASLKR